jgi:hypothetical protein
VRTVVAILCFIGCGAPPREVAVTAMPAAPLDAPHAPDPDLDRPPKPKLLSIDWSTVKLATDADALALWQQIAPTGGDWEDKVFEVPSGPIAKALAVALLREGRFTCAKPIAKTACSKAPIDLPELPESSTLADPCLRRVLAMWSLDQLEPADLAGIRDAIKAIVAIPPPESQLVATVLQKDLDNADQASRLELLAIAWQAGQRELVDGVLGPLDEVHLIEALQKDHFDGALEVLSAEAHREVYLRAVGDTHLATATRVQAIAELSAASPDVYLSDLRATLVATTKTADCMVAAAAAHALELHHEHGAPVRAGAVAMRSLCVVASYEQLQRADETSPLATYLPAKGLELVRVTYDPYSDVDTDGDGDPHTTHTTDLIPRAAAVFPESDDLVRAFAHCKGTTCSSDDRDFRFTFRGGLLARLEVSERPPCPTLSP